MGTTMSERDVRRLGPQLYNGIERNSLAFKLLTSMGWKEGDGLGASKQGIKEHLKVKKKFDSLGMGAAEQMDRTREWTAGMWTFDKVLSGLKEVKAQHKQPAADGSSSSSSEESEDEQQSAKEVRKAGGKAQQKADASKQGKKAVPASQKRQAVSSSSSSSSGSDASSSGEESDDDSDPVPSASPSPGPAGTKLPVSAAARVRMATHVGRYQKRERAKMVRGYSANDLAAILGAAPSPAASQGPAQGVGLKTIRAGRAPTPSSSEASSSASESDSSSGGSSSSSSSDSDSERDSPISTQADKGAGAGTQEVGSSKADAARAGAVLEAADNGPPPWWANFFVRATRKHVGDKAQRKQRGRGAQVEGAGAAGGQQHGKKKILVNGFREQDQENLYEAVQNGAVHGKQGLGRAGMPKKVAGARWQGKKTKLGSDSDSDVTRDSNDEVGLSDVSSSDGEDMDARKGGIVVMAAKSEQQAPAVGSKEPAAAAAGATAQAATSSSKGNKRKRQDAGQEDGRSVGQAKKQNRAAGCEPQGSQAAADEPQEVGDSKAASKGKGSKQAGGGEKQPAAEIAASSKKKKQKKEQTENAAAVDGAHAKPKWAKLIKSMLASAPKRRMSLAKLHKRMLSVQEVAHAAASHDMLHKQLLRKVSKSKKFVVKGEFVHLVTSDTA